MKDGVAQGDGFGSLFFAFGLDEFFTAIREFMRDLQVDSTMVGQVVELVEAADGRLESGLTMLVTNDLPLNLVGTPSYVEVDAFAEAHEGHCARNGPGGARSPRI